MNWKHKEWSKEDELFAPKRKVDNKQSKYIHHNIGSFHSNKMGRAVYYESLWGECLFYYILELDPNVIRYYEQPVQVPIFHYDKDGQLDSWIHIPDVLIFRQGEKPILAQVKVETPVEKIDKVIELRCLEFCKKQDWKYQTIVTKEIPEVVKKNLMFIWNFKKERSHYSGLIPLIQEVMNKNQEVTVRALANSINGTDYRFVIPAIYYMISISLLSADLSQIIGIDSKVRQGSIMNQLTIKGDENVVFEVGSRR
ncbi:TnsA endonuclease N-terminal domain-containing protein [Cytobacillus dafuensis]|uniref:TnsA endonuclease N-terminal domain-containing protein n=1 Tax=Cytobacillus dafuensis TaxID=1742359 RepID=A0A5B8Z332_CYTDA|nr:TnsA endonuclease N-terminal domain-containing protein [Cytobacillus dafuensis]QED46009.1 hypothetical protein FSZ17_01085 [Cytobacillus dafuensis]